MERERATSSGEELVNEIYRCRKLARKSASSSFRSRSPYARFDVAAFLPSILLRATLVAVAFLRRERWPRRRLAYSFAESIRLSCLLTNALGVNGIRATELVAQQLFGVADCFPPAENLEKHSRSDRSSLIFRCETSSAPQGVTKSPKSCKITITVWQTRNQNFDAVLVPFTDPCTYYRAFDWVYL